MTHIILISHGAYAEGMREALDMIMGSADQIPVLGLYPGDTLEGFCEELTELVNAYDDPADVLVLADLPFGTPANAAKMIALQKGISLVSGCGLPLILEAASSMDEVPAKELAEKLCSLSKNCVENFADALQARKEA